MNNLVVWLSNRGLTVRQLGEELKVSHSHVAKVLRGEAPVTWNFAAAVAEGFGLDPLEAFYMAGLLKKGAELGNAQPGPIEKVTGHSIAQVETVVTNGGEA